MKASLFPDKVAQGVVEEDTPGGDRNSTWGVTPNHRRVFKARYNNSAVHIQVGVVEAPLDGDGLFFESETNTTNGGFVEAIANRPQDTFIFSKSVHDLRVAGEGAETRLCFSETDCLYVWHLPRQ